MPNHRNRLVKYIVCTVLALMVAAVSVGIMCACHDARSDYLRLHIRANSNDPDEQRVKLAVRDAVVAYITPLAEGVGTKRQMQRLLSERLDEMTQIATDVLRQNGYTYGATAYLSNEAFPERTYGDLTLPAGYYDAVIVELGSGQGDNWWCVAFPPLCFVAAEDVEGDQIVYRSLIAEWFRKNCK